MATAKPLLDEDISDTQPHPGRRMSEAEFVAWCNDKTWAEWVDGEVIVMPPVTVEHGQLCGFLLVLIRMYTEDQDCGVVLSGSVQIRFGPQRRRRSPDMFFISEARREIIRENHIEGAPDLILEIVSPESVARDWREKYVEYEKAGVREYWIVDPLSKKVEAYVLDRSRKYKLLAEREGAIRSKVLRGFLLKPAWLWQPRLPKVQAALREMGAR